MSGGATFSEGSMLVPPITPAEAVRAFVRISQKARAEQWSRDGLRDVLEALALIDCDSKAVTT